MDSAEKKKNSKIKYNLANIPKPTMYSIIIKRQNILQAAHKGFAYQLLQLEISIELDSKAIGKNKIQDITRLIQLYMIGVEALESVQDSRFTYFNKKLQSLMLKRNVASELHSASNVAPKNDYMLSPKNKEQKRKQHQIQLFYNKQQHQKQKVKELVENVQQKLKSYEGIITSHLKKQQQKIKQRITIRKMKSQTGSVKKLDLNQIEEKYKRNAQTPQKSNQINQFFEEDMKNSHSNIIDKLPSKNLVTTHHRYDI